MDVRPMHPFHRSELLVGAEGFDRLAASSAVIIGLGGVGSYAAEALVRSGFGRVALVDFDRVCITNVNRQLHATRSTVRQFKADLMADRARAINPRAEIVPMRLFYGPETSSEILDPGYDVVLDCIDNMTAKIHLLERCHAEGRYVVCAMGAGGRMDPTRIQVTDLAETRADPFAKIVRQLLRARGIHTGIDCVWSDEPPGDLDPGAEAAFRCICPDKDLKSQHSCEGRHQVQGTVAWMPAMFGMTMAAVAVHHLLDRPITTQRVDRRMRPSDKPSRATKRALLAAAAAEGASEPPGLP